MRTNKNEIVIFSFIQQKQKHDEMAFVMSRNTSKHIRFALGVDRTARDAMKAGVLT